MTAGEIAAALNLEIAAGEGGLSREAVRVFCCDLLSMAMGRAPEGAAWVTVMGNVNSVAVALLADAACIILAEGVSPDEEAVKRADGESIPVLKSKMPAFETAKAVFDLMEV